MFISVKVTNIQNYLTVRKINNKDEKWDIVIDVTKNSKSLWIINFSLLFGLSLIGIVLLII